MGLFDRLRGAGASDTNAPPARRGRFLPTPDGNGWYGRRFRTPASVDECHAHLKALLLESGDDPRLFEARWTDESPPPDVLFGIQQTQDGALYVAIWESRSMVAGQREVAVVPTDFDHRSPFPLAGRWKMRDSDLASIGHITEFSVTPVLDS